jgi:hypothetical protein
MMAPRRRKIFDQGGNQEVRLKKEEIDAAFSSRVENYGRRKLLHCFHPTVAASVALPWVDWVIAMLNHQKGGRTQFAVKMQCSRCGHNGSSLWEEASLPNPRCIPPTLLNLVDGFYQRVKKSDRGVLEVVCDRCGKTWPD